MPLFGIITSGPIMKTLGKKYNRASKISPAAMV